MRTRVNMAAGPSRPRPCVALPNKAQRELAMPPHCWLPLPDRFRARKSISEIVHSFGARRNIASLTKAVSKFEPTKSERGA